MTSNRPSADPHKGGHLPLVSLENVQVKAGGQILLHDVSLEVWPGEALRLAGPNGGGKTTLLRLLAGEVAPVAGARVYGLGGQVRPSAVQARRSLSVVGPDAEAFYLTREWQQTVRDVLLAGLTGEVLNLWQPGAETEAVAEARLQEVARLTRVMPLLERDFRTLSHGQRRRVLLARALMPAPELLLLDEFTDGLSVQARQELGEVLQEVYAAGVAVVLATHRPDEAPALNWRTVYVADGKITDQLPPPPTHRAPPPTHCAPLLTHHSPLISLQNATVYRNGHRALGPLDWTWQTGQHWLVTGENGSGKSTLARLLAGEFYPALGGSVSRPYLNKDLLTERRQTVGLVGAELGIRQRSSLSGREWLGRDVIASGFGGSEGFAENVSAAQWQQVAQIAGALDAHDLLGRPAEKLSQGQLRRLLLARAIVHQPRLLILDEGLDFLDMEARARFEALLPELLAGGTHVMVIAHRTSDAPWWLTHHLHLEGGLIQSAGLREGVGLGEGAGLLPGQN